jgi:putative membrane protein
MAHQEGGSSLPKILRMSTSPVRATDTLANERTFLAYARTALAFIGFGFVIARFALFEREVGVVAHIQQSSPHVSTVFGTVMALAGVGCAVYGAYRYIRSARALRLGANVAMPDGASVAIAGVIAGIGFVVTWVLFAFR